MAIRALLAALGFGMVGGLFGRVLRPFVLGPWGFGQPGNVWLRPFALSGVAMMYTLVSCSSSQLAPVRGGMRFPLALGLLGFGQRGNGCYGRSLFRALP
jgi:hypothetical protein